MSRQDKKNNIVDGNTKIQPSVELMMAVADRMDIYELGVYYELLAHTCMEKGDGLSQRQIARALRISTAKVTQVLKKFEDRGLIVRKHYFDNETPDDIILKDVDKAWEFNPDGSDYMYHQRDWRWK